MDNNTVWLLAGRLHRSGASDDAYPYFKDLDANRRLLPTEQDYELLFLAQARSFADDVIDRLPSAVDEARRRSPAEVETIVGTIPISIAVVIEDEIEFVYLAVRMSGWTDDGPQPPANWTAILWAAVFPWVTDPISEIGFENNITGRPAKDDELTAPPCAISGRNGPPRRLPTASPASLAVLPLGSMASVV